MSNTLDPNLMKLVASQADNNPVSHFFKHRDKLNFEVGDYLIKMKGIWTAEGSKIVPETVSEISIVNKRYKCIYKDEHGICYIQGLSSKGEPLPYVTPLIEWYESAHFVLDPSYADHLILGNEEPFDASGEKKRERARRDKITRENKKISLRFNSKEEIREWWGTVKPGDTIRYGYDMPHAVNNTLYTVVGKKVEKSHYNNEHHEVILVTHANLSRPDTIQIRSIIKHIIFHNTDPIPYEDGLK